MPSVSFWTSETQAESDSGERTSKVKVSMPAVFRSAIFAGFRAVANTRYPIL